MKYQLTQNGLPRHVETGAFVNPETNAEYIAWLADGNKPLPATPPAVDEQIVALEAANPITHRNLRDIMVLLGTLTEQVTGLPADANPAVKKVKALEAQITALRALL